MHLCLTGVSNILTGEHRAPLKQNTENSACRAYANVSGLHNHNICVLTYIPGVRYHRNKASTDLSSYFTNMVNTSL